MEEVGLDLASGEASVFISYDCSQDDIARELARLLAKQGIACWKAPDDVAPGESFDKALADQIDDCDAIALLFSAAADQSQRVEQELDLADELGVPILTLRLEDTEPVRLRGWLEDSQWIDWTDRRGDVVVRLAEQVRRIAGVGPAAPAAAISAEDHPMNRASRRNGVFAAALATIIVLGAIGYGIWSGLD